MRLEKHIAIRTPTSHLELAICMLKVMDFFQVPTVAGFRVPNFLAKSFLTFTQN